MNTLRHSALLIGSLMLTSGSIQAATYDLCVGPTTKIILPEGVIQMWGYGLDPVGSGSCNATVPGPQLDVPVGDSTLTVNLRNTLPSDTTSIMIPGQGLPDIGGTPGTFIDGQGRTRVRSFVSETPSGGGTGTYTWNNIKAGTYAYQSGTHVQIQVQMGLYGAVVKNEANGEAYPGVTYDQDKVLIYSAIDPVLHDTVASGNYGPNGTMTSTVRYQPKYFMVNGEPYAPGSTPEDIGLAGSTTLLRMINMDIDTHAPNLLGGHMDLVAESGYPYPYPRRQTSVNLAPGQSKDALLTLGEASNPPGSVELSLYDRRLNTTNGGTSGGGLVNQFTVSGTAASGDPIYYFSTFANQSRNYTTVVAGLSIENRDVVSFNPATGDWALVFDGSDPAYNLVDASNASIPANIDALHVFSDGRMLMSFSTPTTVPNILSPVGGSAIVMFDPLNVGNEFNIVYTPEELSLTKPGENIDALSLDVNGDLQISTIGSAKVPGLSGIQDEDVIRFSQATRTWGMMFDGSDLSSDFTINAADIDALAHPDANQLLFSIVGNVNPLAGLPSTNDEDIVLYSGSFGLNNTTGLLETRMDMTEIGGFPFYSDISAMSWSSGLPYVNSAPTNGDDAYSLDLRLNATLVIAAPGVLANDTDPDMNSLSAQAGTVTTTLGGEIVIAADGSFSYTPPAITGGTDTATYNSDDSYGGVTQGTITINVETSPEPVNEAPLTYNDWVSTDINTALEIDVLANDTDNTGAIDPSTLHIRLEPTQGGTVVIDPITYRITYTPPINFVGTDIFKYKVMDEFGLISGFGGKVRINVTNP